MFYKAFPFDSRMCLILVFTLLVSLNSLGQTENYERIDASILLYPERFDTPEQLSKYISRDFETDEEKIRAIYGWIILNISYEPDEYKQFNYNFKNYRERNEKEEKLRDKIISRTLTNGVAVCEGYAMLFEKICELQGISNYLVRGDIKSNFNDIGRPFKKSHMWNIAYIDGKPFLFDPTWGAGKYHEKFIKDPSYYFYKTEPELFFKTHYPSMFEDALIDTIISYEVFTTMPLIILKELKIDDVESPMTGIIRSDEYFDAILFRINNCNPKEISYTYGNEKMKVENAEIIEGRLNFSIPLELGVSTLLVYFDDKPALAYKIQ
jgi:hypothetical protein